MSAEEWRPIPGFPGYEVSDQGRVRSTRRYLGSTAPHLLVPQADRKGYLRVGPRRGGRKPTKGVHIFVLLAFVGPRPEGMQVRHIDGDPANNLLTNLAYGTPSENQLDQVRHGRHLMARRTHCKWNHEYTPENTVIRVRPDGSKYRLCVTCAKAASRRGYLKARRLRDTAADRAA